jgi:glycosyltransferase involved in cell wall biosynthesis
VLRDGYVDAAVNAALLALADCVVSLHRSEGFGFNLADAMALGTPVLATAFSGNLTFMREADGNLVPATRVPVGPGRFPYLPESQWAEPDLDAATRMMRALVESPATGRARADGARRRVLQEFTPEATGAFIRDRLAAVRAERRALAAPSPMRRLASRLRDTRRV